MNRENKITVLVVEPEKKPYVKVIENTLKSLQHEVGGYIQAIYPFDDAAVICDEESKLNNKPLNRSLRDDTGEIYDIIAGTFLVVGLAKESFGSLSDEQLRKYAKRFEMPEVFVNYNGKIYSLLL
jgi:antirestriction protein